VLRGMGSSNLATSVKIKTVLLQQGAVFACDLGELGELQVYMVAK